MTSLPLAALLTDAIEFIFVPRDSETGGIMVGGLGEIGALTLTHLKLSAAALALACVIALPLGLWLGHIRKGEFLAVSASNVGRAVPTLAIIAFFIAFLGLGFLNVMLALTLLAIPPLLTNTYVGVSGVSPDAIDAARGMGMSETQIVRRVELPLAVRTIFGGIQLAAVSVVATAILGPLANVDTLGKPIVSNNVYGESGLLGAAIVVALLAILVSLVLTALQRAVTPAGLKVSGQASRGRRRLPFLTRPRST